ncbi:hypothetical protein AV955_gp029 [Diadromus pulchellus ascovirus 4a]|uniref:Complete DpAV4 genome n=1 Tax=Diadromus pulchellus ascovirus 4a TaxID=158683 RepID=F2NYV8_9VIRU|nr:hypothetical protein AV955_gp029 [Diadromus pulchellus ascovirus 4a]CCA61386.1 unnamed protein product [Diadromus pulchellus ascovirus 4a]
MFPNNRPVTWHLENVPPGVSNDTVVSLMNAAFSAWSVFINLSFVYSEFETSDVIVAFRSGKHPEDAGEFDGPRGVLAHATLGSNPGFIHFDSDENWNWDEYPSFVAQAFSLRPIFKNVATHEVGHLIGMKHRSEYGSIMNTYYAGTITEPSATDIAKARSIYGTRPGSADPVQRSAFYYFVVTNISYILLAIVTLIIVQSTIVYAYKGAQQRRRIYARINDKV